MSLKPDTIAQIQAMLDADPALMAQLQSAADADSAVALPNTAASAKGIAFSDPELAVHLQEAAEKQAQMSDTELGEVAAGRDRKFPDLTNSRGSPQDREGFDPFYPVERHSWLHRFQL